MKTSVLLAACSVLLLGAGAARANTPDADNPTCPSIQKVFGPLSGPVQVQSAKVDGRRVVKFSGAIVPGAADKLERALEESRDPIDEVWIGSSGGDAAEGLKIGKMIRAMGVPTRVPNGWGCASACNFAFMGGAIRTIDEGAAFAVHMFTITASTDYQAYVDVTRKGNDSNMTLNNIARREQASALLATEENDFLIRMGISRRLLTEVMYQQKADTFSGSDKSTLRCLSSEELQRYNVVNAE
ncbi:hypothetical protein [Caulobacter sp. RHG1]|uniref:COG3904 family protein n=1 Tax=Caulobacter sp. (strain RHG1) TaxID=2545762 RepID=UPI001553E2F9|nr:hypothetical protein [Caulobacter sp. RHG1]NQE64375.1 hypothetical protein [Caulobacter sp. RHG1]